MSGGPPWDPRYRGTERQAAGGGPPGVGPPVFAQIAARLLDLGYAPLPIVPGSKRPAPSRWTQVAIDEARLEDWSDRYPDHGVGLRTGQLLGLDIDLEDPDLAHRVASEAVRGLGDTLVRVGRWPRRLLLYRTAVPLGKLQVPGVEILGAGQQFVAFARHPDTGQAYRWVTGDSPCDVPLEDLPEVDQAALERFLSFAATQSGPQETPGAARRRARPETSCDGPVRDARGIVIDGRDAWLSTIAFHVVHDARDLGEVPDATSLAERVWERFTATTDLLRACKDGDRRWSEDDARRKVADKIALLAAGRLPDRALSVPEPEDPGPLLPPAVARARLVDAIDAALAEASDWWNGHGATQPPVRGIRATVGLGKSAMSRVRIAAWQREMAAQGLRQRVLVLTPSHVLAEEAAVEWTRVADGPVAVLRGYEGRVPVTGDPMCRDVEIVRLSLAEGLSVARFACKSSSRWTCRHFEGCLKQENRRDVAAARIVVAPYDVLFTGPAAGPEPFGLIVIDEGCWQRSSDDAGVPSVELLGGLGLNERRHSVNPAAAASTGELGALRQMAVRAFETTGVGAVGEPALAAVGLDPAACLRGVVLEEMALAEAAIYPGMKRDARIIAREVVRRNAIARRMAALWKALAHIVAGDADAPVVRIGRPDRKGRHGVTLHGHLRIVDGLARVPILHLDAALRPGLAQVLLPGLTVEGIDAEQRHQSVTLVTGRFGKSALCPEGSLAAEEAQRRRNRLREVVDHVAWEARRVAPRRTLVVTYKAIEEAFGGIPGVETGHFNAIAGLDRFRDVGLLVVVGRPLPSSDALGPLCASLFGHYPEGGYVPDLGSVRLRSGGVAPVRTLMHPEPRAELLRRAICEDELLQAVGRGRGVNRTEDDPLEVQILADVALPLVHDRVVPWEVVRPDVFQRMLLAGVAVDSPADAVVLHSQLFEAEKQAQKLFERTAFKRQNPIRDTYREMSLKSAAYRRAGRGRSWQRAYWICGAQDDIADSLRARLGPLEYKPDD